MGFFAQSSPPLSSWDSQAIFSDTDFSNPQLRMRGCYLSWENTQFRKQGWVSPSLQALLPITSLWLGTARTGLYGWQSPCTQARTKAILSETRWFKETLKMGWGGEWHKQGKKKTNTCLMGEFSGFFFLCFPSLSLVRSSRGLISPSSPHKSSCSLSLLFFFFFLFLGVCVFHFFFKELCVCHWWAAPVLEAGPPRSRVGTRGRPTAAERISVFKAF